MVAWYYRDYFKKSSRCYLLTAAIIVTESFWGASTGLTGAILYLLLLLVPWFKRILTPMRAVVLAGFLIISIVFIQQYDYLNFLLSRMYSDNLDFSGRFTIWTSAIRAIQRSPLIGYGSRSASGDVVSILGVGEWASHCHNHILQIMFMGGIVALILFVLMIYGNIKVCVQIWKLEGTNTSRICLYAVFVYLIIGITEQYEYVPMYLIPLLPYYFCIARQKCEVAYQEKNSTEGG